VRSTPSLWITAKINGPALALQIQIKIRTLPKGKGLGGEWFESGTNI